MQHPYLVLGDILGRRRPPPDDETDKADDAAQANAEQGGPPGTVQGPDLFLILNAQCDLAFTPDQEGRAMDPDRSLLLLPGSLRPLDDSSGDRPPKTELYRQRGRSYRIAWDAKKVLSVPYGNFSRWHEEHERERVGRLRLPFALDIQRVFTADLTRVGNPVMPPIYQPVTVEVLPVNGDVYDATDFVGSADSAFLILGRHDSRRQCVLTMPLVAYLKEQLEKHLDTMRAGDTGGPNNAAQIASLARAPVYGAEWQKLEDPFTVPGATKPLPFLNRRIQVLRGANIGDKPSDSYVQVAVSLHFDE